MPSDFLEKTLEDIIFENRGMIHTRGLDAFKLTAFRQVVLPSGKKMDIIAYKIVGGHISIDLYELKKDTINLDAICQAYNYFAEMSVHLCGSFKTYDIHIIMIGRRYEPIPLFDKMKLPVSVFVYDYGLNGISFTKMQSRQSVFTKRDNFGLALRAFGTGMLYYPGSQPDIVNLEKVYEEYAIVHPSFDELVKKNQMEHFGSVFTREVFVDTVCYRPYPKFDEVKFPDQPHWSEEFAKSIPHDEETIWLDFENDDSDWEIDCDMEVDYESNDADEEYNWQVPHYEDQTNPISQMLLGEINEEYDELRKISHSGLL